MSSIATGSHLRGAVLGFPVDHSLSPLLHKAILSALDMPSTYERIAVESGTLSSFFAKNKESFDYLSLTMPLKEEALTLDVEIDPLVTRIQSANTLYRRGSSWHLTSTDGQGFLEAIQSLSQLPLKSVLVLGAGGTARAIVGALDGVASSITVSGRSDSRRPALEAAVEESDFTYLRWSDSLDFSPFDLIVNTTPAGAADILASSIPSQLSSILFEVIYKPWPTILAARWSDSGGLVINGAEMLLFQGIRQVELVLDRKIDHMKLASLIRPVLREALK